MTDIINTDDYADSQVSLEPSIIEWDQKGHPLSKQFQDVYFSPKNGLDESRYVFLEHNQLTQRFNQLTNDDSFVIGETGFGTGLNFLSCWQHWLVHAPKNAQLSYISIEKHPLLPNDLKRSLALWPSLSLLADELCQSYAMHFTSTQTPQYKTLTFGNVRLLLLIDDAELGLRRLLPPHDANASQDCTQSALTIKPGWQGVDAWFLDGFTPARNPEMWTKSLFTAMALLSNKDSTFSTFTAASAVRHDLGEAGFDVTKAPGFGTKREMLYGVFNSDRHKADKLECVQKSLTTKPVKSLHKFSSNKRQHKNTINLTPWAEIKDFRPLSKKQSIAIIGAGLAGCHTANALAKRGYKVTLIDRHNTIASEASGNPQGVLYAKLSAHAQTLSDFNLQALLYAQDFYQHYWSEADSGDCCGVLQLSYNDRTQKNHQAIHNKLQHANSIKYIDPSQASRIANVAIKHSALYFPYCGWLKPQSLCQKLCDHQNITVITNTSINSLVQSQDSNSWLLEGEVMNEMITAKEQQKNSNDGSCSWNQCFDQVVIANAVDASRFEQTQWLPTKSVRGQISYLKSQAPFSRLKTVICAEGYIPPATDMLVAGEAVQTHALGASFNLHSQNEELDDKDHLDNLANVAKYFTDETVTTLANQNAADTAQAKTKLTIEDGRVGFRCTSPDYLPLVGPAPIYSQFKESYKPLSRDAKTFVPELGSYFTGLYVNIGHGSRGLAYTPLAAEILACTMAQQPLPLSQDMANALNPARFIIRDLIRSNK